MLGLLLVIGLAACGSTIDKKATKKTAEKVERPKTENQVSWEDKVKEVASSEGTTTEKFDQITLFANDYKPTKGEIKDFEQYIIKEYKDKKYLNDISNHEYMLGNIFKSYVIEKYYNDDEKKPMDSFALDFFQNSKYNYRGVDTKTSESTLSNEKQMDEALAKMNK